MTAFFASCLAVSLILDALTIFSQDRTRWRYRALLVVVLVLVWVLLGLLLTQIVGRTSSIVPSAKIWAPERLPTTGRDAAVLLASFGGPAVLATVLGVWALRASRRKRPSRSGRLERWP
ncbi:MAG: hypothetical protein ACJ78W_18435 [Myxococcales bacterium]